MEAVLGYGICHTGLSRQLSTASQFIHRQLHVALVLRHRRRRADRGQSRDGICGIVGLEFWTFYQRLACVSPYMRGYTVSV